MNNKGSEQLDLRLIFSTLWDGKLVIILTTVLFTVASVLYAISLPEVWTTKAKIQKAEFNDYYNLHSEVDKYLSILNNNDGKTKLLESYLEPKKLLGQYVNVYNASINKKDFLLSEKGPLNAFDESDVNTTELNLQLNQWYKNIKITPENRRSGSPNFYFLSVTSNSAQDSYNMLTSYNEFVSKKVNEQIIGDLEQIVSSYTQGLEEEYKLLEKNAKSKLALEKNRTQIAIQIARQASIENPILTYRDNDIFNIQLGAKANEAKYKALKDLDIQSLSLFEPELVETSNKLNALRSIKATPSDFNFSTYHFIESIELPLNRDKPKRSQIVILGFMFGAMLGAMVVLVVRVFKTKS